MMQNEDNLAEKKTWKSLVLTIFSSQNFDFLSIFRLNMMNIVDYDRVTGSGLFDNHKLPTLMA